MFDDINRARYCIMLQQDFRMLNTGLTSFLANYGAALNRFFFGCGNDFTKLAQLGSIPSVS